MDKLSDFARMIVWLLAGLALYAAAMMVGSDRPAVQTVLYKLGHVTTLAWVGYWLARGALGRIVSNDNHRKNYTARPSAPIELLARAVLVGAVIIAGSLGL